jgi:hypothetical protein
LPERLAERLEALIANRPAIVDLSGTIVVSAAPVVGLVGWVLASGSPDWCCVVCPRGTARALLRKWHITRCLAVFGSIGDALQARRCSPTPAVCSTCGARDVAGGVYR